MLILIIKVLNIRIIYLLKRIARTPIQIGYRGIGLLLNKKKQVFLNESKEQH